jgi:hypothetical protein
MHKDLGARRGDLEVVKGRSIGAAPWVDLGLRRLLIEAGLDLKRDVVEVAPVPGAMGQSVNFGLTCGQSPQGSQDRRLLGEWHGCGGGSAPRGRNRSARCAPRRWPETVFQLHDGVDRDERSPDRAIAYSFAGSRSGDRGGPRRVERGRDACDKDWTQTLSAGRGGPNRRATPRSHGTLLPE